MEINFNTYPISSYNKLPHRQREAYFSGYRVPNELVEKAADNFVRRPVATTSATGLRGLKGKVQENITGPVAKYFRNYKRNLVHTYEHKVIFAIIEKQLFGKNTMDSVTHDADKLIMYMLGFPKSFVSKFHRMHSSHHHESKIKPNLRTMLIDNIASSPEFKPEKELSFRDYYSRSKDLQEINGLGELLDRYNFGEDLDFQKIKQEQKSNSTISHAISRVFSIIF